ncbi:hypothetical protein ACFCYX_05700 [Streptomyces populi]|uniref:hypothetical protein n=1 Tax=Streptomyces populi TaxID=2058924 RepID=UPI0035D7B5E3
MKKDELTDAQKKAFEENKAAFRELDEHRRSIQEAARARLTAHGWEPGLEEHIPCLSCPCPDFQHGGPLGTCRRSTCGHPLIDHDLPL